MDLSPSASSPAPGSPGADLQADLRALRLSVSLMLVSLVILSGSLGLYLFRQVSLLRRQAEAASRTATQAVQHYRQNVEPQALRFEQRLRDFALTNVDFQARIAKYYPAGTQGAAVAGSNTPSAAPATPAAR